METYQLRYAVVRIGCVIRNSGPSRIELKDPGNRDKNKIDSSAFMLECVGTDHIYLPLFICPCKNGIFLLPCISELYA